MRRRSLLRIAAGTLVMAACAPPATPVARPASRPPPLPVLLENPPDLSAATTWFNSRPMTLADLKGQPFVMVFWTYT
jgi:hypothetical protein